VVRARIGRKTATVAIFAGQPWRVFAYAAKFAIWQIGNISAIFMASLTRLEGM
jgi:uncharacterized membrane protein